jgi:hypothetical protein
MHDYVVGVDPGYSGAIVVMDMSGTVAAQARLDWTEHDIHDAIAPFEGLVKMSYLERVHAMPKQGVSSTFKFGTSYGFCRGVLVCCRMPFTEVTPAKWQTVMKCRSGGDKKVTKAAAQRLFPSMKVTHRNADALLIAEYGRRTWSSI